MRLIMKLDPDGLFWSCVCIVGMTLIVVLIAVAYVE